MDSLEALGTKHWIAIVVEKEAMVGAEEIAVGGLVEIGGVKVMLVDGEVQEVDEVDYLFTVTNPTERPLQVVGLTDVFFSREPAAPVGEQDLLEAFPDANGSDVLADDASVGFVVTFTLTEGDLDRGFIDNTVTVVAVDEETGTPATDTDDDLTDLTLVDDKIGDLSDALVAAVATEHGGPVLPIDGQVTITAAHDVTATVALVRVLAEAEELPRTVTNGAGLLDLGLLLTVLGAAVLLFGRRQRATRR